MTTLVAPVKLERQSVAARWSRPALAASGLLMLAYVIVHMAGNLLAFAGSSTFNAYARWLREVGAPSVGEETVLWAARLVLTAALITHLVAHAYLFFRPDTPVREVAAIPPWYATLPVEWMFATGVLIALFVAFHLAQLTIGATLPGFVTGDAYHNLVAALGFWPVSIAYIGVAVAVAAHVLPGVWTGMRSLGLIRPSTETLATRLSIAIPLVVVIGLSSVPLAVLVGVLR